MARPRQISDEDILAAARAVFVEQGPAASTQAIAATLGVSQPALFRRFGSKEELMLAALAPPQKPDWVAFVERGPDARPLRAQIADIAERATRFLADLVPCISVLRASGMTPETLFSRYEKGPPVLLAVRALAGWVERAQTAGLVRNDVAPMAAATLFLGSLQLPAFLAHISMGRSPVNAIADPDHVAQLVDLISTSLEAP